MAITHCDICIPDLVGQEHQASLHLIESGSSNGTRDASVTTSDTSYTYKRRRTSSARIRMSSGMG